MTGLVWSIPGDFERAVYGTKLHDIFIILCLFKTSLYISVGPRAGPPGLCAGFFARAGPGN